jgi:hypothetical protein
MEKRLAKIINYGVSLTKDNDPCIIVNFKTKVSETDYVDMMWQGPLKEGRAREITIDALIALGLRDGNLNSIARNAGLDKEKTVELSIEDEYYNGKSFKKIKWINEVGTGAKQLLAANDAVLKLAGLNLEGDVLFRLQEKGLAKKAGPYLDEIPF